MTANATINVSVSSHYLEPTYASEVTSQGLLGERVEILEVQSPFTKIRQADLYESWISSDQVTEGEMVAGREVLVRDHFLRIYSNPSTDSEPLKDAVLGCRLTAVDEQEDWYRIALPGSPDGWAEKRHFSSFPDFSPENVVALARECLGYQYTWGGRSPKGFDCSGLVQTVFSLLGVTLPRDSWQQQLENHYSDNLFDAEAGDLLFFGKTPERVTHVAISLGNGRFIHASGWVRRNSFNENEPDYSPDHIKTFISVNRYRPEVNR